MDRRGFLGTLPLIAAPDLGGKQKKYTLYASYDNLGEDKHHQIISIPQSKNEIDLFDFFVIDARKGDVLRIFRDGAMKHEVVITEPINSVWVTEHCPHRERLKQRILGLCEGGEEVFFHESYDPYCKQVLLRIH